MNGKALIVDDSATMRKVVMKHVKSLGWSDLLEAKDGKEALEQVKGNGDIAIIFSDWNMPEMNGFEFLVEFRKDTSKKQIPFIMVTTEAEKESIVKAIKAGANNYILKPFTEETFKEKTSQTLEKMGIASGG